MCTYQCAWGRRCAPRIRRDRRGNPPPCCDVLLGVTIFCDRHINAATTFFGVRHKHTNRVGQYLEYMVIQHCVIFVASWLLDLFLSG